MADEPTTPVTQSEGLTESEVEAIVGRAMDARTAPILERLSQLPQGDNTAALTELRTSILTDVTKLLDERKTTPLDEAGLLSKVDSLLDKKLATIGVQSKRIGGPLSKWLGFA